MESSNNVGTPHTPTATAGRFERRRSNFDREMDAWMARLGDENVAMMMTPTSRGTLANAPQNIIVWLENMPPYKGRIRFNEFTSTIELDGRPLQDTDIARISNEVFKYLGFYHKANTYDAIDLVSQEHKYHPVKEYLDKLVWDGVPRVETFFIDRLGAPDTPLTREITTKWMYSTLKRVLEPGCTFDHYLIVSDPQQGTGKSKVFERLTEPMGIGGATKNNIKPDLGDKDNLMYLNNCIIGLFDESNAIKYSALEAFKTFVTTNEFTLRLPYAKTVSTFKIHCTYVGTTNEQTFLTDTTSPYERRAWVLLCHGDPYRTREEWDKLNGPETIGQVWAELKHWYHHQSEAPWPIEGTSSSYLTAGNEEELRRIQEGAKTSNDDSDVINAIQTILTQCYTKAVFGTAYDFQNDHRFHFSEGDYRFELEKIPFKWFAGYVNHLAGGKVHRTNKYIRQLITSGCINSLIGEWEYNYLRYNGVRQACLQNVKRVDKECDADDAGGCNSVPEPGIKPAESSPLFGKASMKRRKEKEDSEEIQL